MASFDKSDTRSGVVDIIAQELKVDKGTIADTVTLDALGADSLDIVQIIMHLEERFGMEINDEDAEHMRSLNDIVEYVHTRRTK